MPSARIVRGFDLYEKLREHKPASLVAYDQDDDQIKVNVPDVRQRHARCIEALKEIAWVKVDLLDKKGGLLHRHIRCADDRENPAGDLEDLRPTTRQAAELQGLVSVISTAILKAQDLALARQAAGTQQLLDSHGRLADSMSRRLDLQEEQLRHAMTLNHGLSSDLVSAQLAQLQLYGGGGHAGGATGEDGEPRAMSDRAVDAVLPAFLRAALGFPPNRPKQVHHDDGKPNGTKPKKGAGPAGPDPRPAQQPPSATD